MAKDNDVTVGLAVFCIKCMSALRAATCEDMNGDSIECKKCGTHSESAVGITVNSDSLKMLHHTYQQMKKHQNLVTDLLQERNLKD